MNILVVFDGTDAAVQNLRAGLTAMKRDPRAQVRICIPQVLQDAIPSNAAVATMASGTHTAFARARHTLGELNADAVGFELVPATNVDLADQIAQSAERWQADTIYIALGGACEECQKITRRSRFFGRRPVAYAPPPPSFVHGMAVTDLLNAAPCNLSVTCHEDVVMTLQVVNPRHAIKSKPAYQDDTSIAS